MLPPPTLPYSPTFSKDVPTPCSNNRHDGRYQGKTKTLYSIRERHYTINSKVEKAFKRITVYLEGRNLFDVPETVTFISEDFKDTWTEKRKLNRRLILLGFKWNFIKN